MSREVAMEQYISLLSRSIPGWTGYDAKVSILRNVYVEIDNCVS